MRSKLSLLGLLLVLVAINVMIAQKESALANGQSIYLELAPVDPRSLMQGDYMALRYALADQVPASPEEGVVYATLDARKVVVSLSAEERVGTQPLRYRHQNDETLFDAESYFFQEGQGSWFQQARYAELRVDAKGMPILVGLMDEKLQPIMP
jgi:uncharacterized membrane-anchored protein